MSWPSFWAERRWPSKLLWPLSKLVCWEAARRLKAFEQHPPAKKSTATILVVGNLVVGGSGKTPFIVWLVKQLQVKNLKVGIISRGYGGKSQQWPQWVTPESSAELVGDEPVLLAKQLGCPIAVSPVRADAVSMLQTAADLDVIISDDGLQHYGLVRDIEVVLVDSQRLWGNGLCLPAGPLREAKTRLNRVDYVVYNGERLQGEKEPAALEQKSFTMRLQPVCFRQVANPSVTLPAEAFSGQNVTAMAGIGNPQRFFDTLTSLSISIETHAFKDHHGFREEDFSGFDCAKPLLMTEKDAVKCTQLAVDSVTQEPKNWWYLEVAPQADSDLLKALTQRIQHLNGNERDE